MYGIIIGHKHLKNIDAIATVEYRGIPGTFDFAVYSDANGYLPHDN